MTLQSYVKVLALRNVCGVLWGLSGVMRRYHQYCGGYLVLFRNTTSTLEIKSKLLVVSLQSTEEILPTVLMGPLHSTDGIPYSTGSIPTVLITLYIILMISLSSIDCILPQYWMAFLHSAKRYPPTYWAYFNSADDKPYKGLRMSWNLDRSGIGFVCMAATLRCLICS